jgi:diguanylate cyclase (GGDEF)-like protein/PAS domain S-box-containing protein
MRLVKPHVVRGSGDQQSELTAHDLEEVLGQIGEAVLVKDLDAVVTYWNREAAALYGFSAQEAVGQSLRKLHAADLSDADYARLLERVRAGVATSTTTERRKKSGETVRVALRTTPLRDPQGTLVGEITVARDVTALHRTEEALRAAQATLQSRLAAISDATQHLTREVAARRKAAAALRQLASFHRDGEALSRMAELLQSSRQLDEAYAIVRETGSLLFPESSGSLFIYPESRNLLEHVTSWGSARTPDATLAPEECWALRLGKPHFVPSKATIGCPHASEGVESYVCMPVQGQGQVQGLFHIAVEVSPRTMRPARDVEERLHALADRIGPALANLKLREALRDMALRDGLTGLYSRRYLEDALGRELLRAERSGKQVSLVMVDIDRFKSFNDKYGHAAGDFVLSAVARVIMKSVRSSDIACRYGGEELAIVLPEASLECGRARAEEMRLAMQDTNLAYEGQTLPAPTASFGVAVYPANGTKPADLLKAADGALYRAKLEGRDRVCVPAEAATAGRPRHVLNCGTRGAHSPLDQM